MVGINEWLCCSAWMWTPLREAGRSCSTARCFGNGCGERERIVSGLWTDLHLEAISGQLKRLGSSVFSNTVRRLLGELDVALHANTESLSGPQSSQQERFVQAGLPVVSMDTKKKEQVGYLKNSGRIRSREALRVNDHEFLSLSSGVAIPRGLCDVPANRGWVLAGTSHDTA